jgi:hypothetical protein
MGSQGGWTNELIESLTIPSQGGPNRIEINVGNSGAINVFNNNLLIATIDPNGFTSVNDIDPTVKINLNDGLFVDGYTHNTTNGGTVLTWEIGLGLPGWGISVEGEPHWANVAPDVLSHVYVFGNSDTQLATVAFDATQVLTTAGIQYSADNLNPEVMSNFTYAAGPGWANAGGAANPNAQYRLVPVPSNSTQFVGRMTPGGTKADGTVIGTIDAAHAPISHRMSFPVSVDVVAAGRSPRFDFETNGNVICQGCSAATNVFANGIFSRDL